MDLSEVLNELRLQKERVEQAIASLEKLQGRRLEGHDQLKIKGRGRKSMSLDERKEVSARMKRYWESQRDKLEH